MTSGTRPSLFSCCLPVAAAKPDAPAASAASDKPAAAAAQTPAAPSPKKVHVVVHSLWGHIKAVGEEIVAGLKAEGVDAKLWQVPETLPKEVLDKMHAQTFDLPVIKPDDLVEADGILFGLATRYGGANAQIRAFLDSTGSLFASSALDGKFAGIFTSTSTQHGGVETTALSFVPVFAHLGMIFVPFGFKSGQIFGHGEVHGASPWGAGTIAPSDGSRNVSDLEKEIAREQGKRFAGVVNRLKAEARDTSRIRKLVKGGAGKDDMTRTLQRRFGDDFDLAALIDLSPLSIVATDPADSHICGFVAFTLVPPLGVVAKTVPKDDPDAAARIVAGAWDAWIKSNFEFKDAQIHNCVFIAFFCDAPDCAVPFLDAALTTLFETMPTAKFVCYFLPDSLILFPPFSSPRHQPGASALQAGDTQAAQHGQAAAAGIAADAATAADGHAPRRRFRNMRRGAKYFVEMPLLNSGASFSLQVCHRKDTVPSFRVRKARVEDCDDLVPIFRRQNLLKTEHADYFLASLVEAKSESTCTLVAEADGEVVGFMSVSRDFDHAKLHEGYHLEMFDYLMKNVRPLPDKVARAMTPTPVMRVGASEAQDAHDATVETAGDPDMDRPQPQPSAAAPPIDTDELVEVYDPSELETPNAFCINMFCIENQFAHQAVDFVRAAFQMFKARDYCLISLPHGTPQIRMLDHFSPVQARSGCIAPHNLFITNRFGAGELAAVRAATEADINKIDALTFGLRNQNDVMTAAREAIKQAASPLSVLVAEAADQVVAAIVLRQCDDAQPLTDQFEIEMFVSPKACALSGKPVVVEHIVFNPLFEVQARWVLHEVQRQTGSPCLVLVVDDVRKRDFATLRIARREMVPVRRRRIIQFPNNVRDGVQLLLPLALNVQIITPALLFEPRVIVNSRIVVLGGSDVSTAFLEHLVYTPHLHFTHVTLISADGAPRVDDSGHFASSRCFTSLELKQQALEHFVEIIAESAAELDRESKLVRLSGGKTVQYDYLVLCPGLQFHVEKLDPSLAQLQGVYSMNMGEHTTIVNGVRAFKDAHETTAIVFGRSVQAYAAVEMMLREGVAGNRIVMVDPVPASQPSCFDDPAVDERIFGELKRMGVQHLRGHRILRWGVDKSTPVPSLFGVVLVNRETDETLRLQFADMLIYADERSIDMATFKLINNSCLVFDGRLVIDKHFRTDDPFIFGAGSVTKYASRYETKWSHANYDSREVGRRLAETLLPVFDPTVAAPQLDTSLRLLEFVEPKKCEARLPSGLHYLHFDRPHLLGQRTLERADAAGYGRDLVIDTPELGLFKIHLDTQGFIRSLTVLGPREVAADNLMCLFGMHERYLNRLVARFDEGVISDFVDFFSQTWALPLFHDRFPSFSRSSRLGAITDGGEDIKDIVSHLRHYVVSGKQQQGADGGDGGDGGDGNSGSEPRQATRVPERERQMLYSLFDQSPDRKDWDAKAFEFLLDSKVFAAFP
ncbi:hypothetical protein HK105_202835 [Polyrhizophydium stewartii]|uniref:Flavodoxin-like domain-containing protein n=1 Tax=Polyrhizophydium stewartii TaxID=2732419 RepID=A0ABR4NDE1_9FUNG